MSVFDFSSYKPFVVDKFEKMPKKGRGQFRKLALQLGVSPVIVSQVFKGDRHLSLEQAYDCCDYFGFSRLERDYFLLLVQHERAGTIRLQQALKEQMAEIKDKALDLKNRIKATKQLSEEDKAEFYSNWYYSGIRLVTDIDDFNSPEKIADYFGLPLVKVRKILEFLLAHGLVKESGNKLSVGQQSTHISKSSPLVANHHRNWRVQALKKMETPLEHELFFTGPMVLSVEAGEEIKREIVNLISKTSKTIAESKSEKLSCLNIDWFDF